MYILNWNNYTPCLSDWRHRIVQIVHPGPEPGSSVRVQSSQGDRLQQCTPHRDLLEEVDGPVRDPGQAMEKHGGEGEPALDVLIADHDERGEIVARLFAREERSAPVNMTADIGRSLPSPMG